MLSLLTESSGADLVSQLFSQPLKLENAFMKSVRSSANIMIMMDVDAIVYSKIRMDAIGRMGRGFV